MKYKFAKSLPSIRTLLTICVLGFIAGCSTNPNVMLHEDEVDASAGNLPCFKIETPAATYLLEKEGGGLSSMIDPEGIDWIGFHPDPGTGAGGAYRGFPNAIYKQDGSFFHPKNEGTEPSELQIIRKEKDLVSIKAISGNGNWEAIWDFHPTHCTFTMTKIASGYAFWVLYEGVPGGSYDESDWYMTSAIQNKIPLTTNHETDIPDPEWIAFGDLGQNRTLFLYHHEDDQEIDRFYQMQQKMTVFGFGRNGMEMLMNTVPQSFSIGFTESTDHSTIENHISQKIAK